MSWRDGELKNWKDEELERAEELERDGELERAEDLKRDEEPERWWNHVDLQEVFLYNYK